MSREQILKHAAAYVQLTNRQDQLNERLKRVVQDRQEADVALTDMVLAEGDSIKYIAIVGSEVCLFVRRNLPIQTLRCVVNVTPSIQSDELVGALQRYAQLDEELEAVRTNIQVTTSDRELALAELRGCFGFPASNTDASKDPFVILLGDTAVLLYDSNSYIASGCVVASGG
jgi:hypothetical protein